MNNNIFKIDEKTYRIEDTYVRFFLLIGDEKALVIDSGTTAPDVRKIASEIASLPLILLNTHGDGDHISGNGAFNEFYMHPADYENKKIANMFPDSKLIPLSDGDVIDLGNRPLEIIYIPGHTAGSVAVLDKNNRRLFSGDTVQSGHIFMFGDHRRPASFADSLKKLMSMQDKFDEIIASHDEPVLPADYIQKVYDCWQQVLEGKVDSHPIELHGCNVNSYDCEYCGFFL